MKKNTITKIVAGLAFLGIVVSIIGTGLLIIFSNSPAPVELTQEQIQEFLDSQSGSFNNSGSITATGTADIPELDVSELFQEENISQ